MRQVLAPVDGRFLAASSAEVVFARVYLVYELLLRRGMALVLDDLLTLPF